MLPDHKGGIKLAQQEWLVSAFPLFGASAVKHLGREVLKTTNHQEILIKCKIRIL